MVIKCRTDILVDRKDQGYNFHEVLKFVDIFMKKTTPIPIWVRILFIIILLKYLKQM